MISAQVKLKRSCPIDQVILTLDADDYRMLIECLRSHADNKGLDKYHRVVNCGTAQTLLLAIQDAVKK